mgnify:CR=1 FL=1
MLQTKIYVINKYIATSTCDWFQIWKIVVSRCGSDEISCNVHKNFLCCLYKYFRELALTFVSVSPSVMSSLSRIWKPNEPRSLDVPCSAAGYGETRMTFHRNESSPHLSLLLYTRFSIGFAVLSIKHRDTETSVPRTRMHSFIAYHQIQWHTLLLARNSFLSSFLSQ